LPPIGAGGTIFLMATVKPSEVTPALTPEEVAALKAEHRALDLRLSELQRHISLSPEEQVESARLKKLKLATKDLIAQTMRIAK
jgi:hypothetical protein